MQRQVSRPERIDSKFASEANTEGTLWEFVSPAVYAVPALPVRSAVAQRVAMVRNFLRHSSRRPEIPVKREADLNTLSPILQSRFVRALPWEEASQGLALALGDWPSSSCEGDARLVIGQPFSGHAEFLTIFASQHHAVRIPSPSEEQIFTNDSRWFSSWPSLGLPWVLPRLERCFLRHARGLDLVRTFLNLVADGKLGPGIFGCASWSWAYLRRVAPVPCAGLTLQAFDAERLQRLFLNLAALKSSNSVHFCNAITGRDILVAPAKQEPPREEFFQLAAYCRGNVSTAAYYWRERLRSEPDPEAFAQENGEERRPSIPEDVTRIWVADMPEEPVLPTECEEEMRLIMHASLVHDGLPTEFLEELLPWPIWKSEAFLQRMRQLGLLHCPEKRWVVREGAYAAVRRMLRSHGYLVDDF